MDTSTTKRSFEKAIVRLTRLSATGALFYTPNTNPTKTTSPLRSNGYILYSAGAIAEQNRKS